MMCLFQQVSSVHHPFQNRYLSVTRVLVRSTESVQNALHFVPVPITSLGQILSGAIQTLTGLVKNTFGATLLKVLSASQLDGSVLKKQGHAVLCHVVRKAAPASPTLTVTTTTVEHVKLNFTKTGQFSTRMLAQRKVRSRIWYVFESCFDKKEISK